MSQQNEKETMITKQVAYSYPSSNNAEHFGFADGCFVVQLIDVYQRGQLKGNRKPPVALAGFATSEEAHGYADRLPMEYDRFSIKA